MPGLLGKKIGMTSVFSADGKKCTMHCYRSRSLCCYSGKDRREKMAMQPFSWVSRTKRKNIQLNR